MINYLKGNIINSNQSLTVFVNAIGIGFEVLVPNITNFSIGQEVTFYTYMHWNQEQGPSLFGFLSEIEKKIFELVISCSGIGPKIGLAVLSVMKPAEFIRSINEQDIKALSSINGIGSKKAEQMILQLKHKISLLLNTFDIEQITSGNYKCIKDVTDVLNSLNYSKLEVNSATDYLKNNFNKENFTFDQMLKHALMFLSKRI